MLAVSPDLPVSVAEAKPWSWDDFAPHFDELNNRPLNADTIDAWLTDWTHVQNVLNEIFSRARVATTQNTVDEQAEAHLKHLLAAIYPSLTQANNQLQRRLTDSGLQPENFELPLRKMQVDIDLFREENIPLYMREQALSLEYNKLTGAQTVMWDGEEVTLLQLGKVNDDHDRDRREAAYHLVAERWLQDRAAINELWKQFLSLRRDIATNAGYDNYRDFRWKQMKRFDYTPEDCGTFHSAIEQVAVPAMRRIRERRRQRLGLETLRPWDTSVDPDGRPPLRPWTTIEEFAETAESIFDQVDPQLGGYYSTMRRENLLDLPNRKHKGPGAYCTRYPLIKRPFVFMNAVGSQGDVRTLLHEVGHAFHGFEVLKLPYIDQQNYPIEFAEVASMAMELLAAPYLSEEHGGYFSPQDAARDRIQHLEKIVLFWPYMAVVDAFQHWIYTGDEADDPAKCDAKWNELWDRFEVGVDYSGLDDHKVTGWHRKQHIHRIPFYYIEYGLAQLGAVQVWANALKDQAGAVAAYRRALALGGTRSLPELFGAAGAKFAFDAETLGAAVSLIERTIGELEAVLEGQ